MTRSWRARPEDCLYPTNPDEPLDKYQHWGIARFQVALIPRQFDTEVETFVEKGKPMAKEFQTWIITPTHDPEPNLYSHSEVRVSRQGWAYSPNAEPPRPVRSSFRREMEKAFVDICKEPE